MQRRSFLAIATGACAATAALSTVPGAARVASDDPLPHDPELSIDDAQRAMQTGAMTSRSLAELYLHRIEAIDRNGPRLGAIVETNPDALAIADALDRERHARGPRGPLHGMPVVVKDNIDTGDRMSTSAGSLALEHSRARHDAFVVQQLRKAGCVVLAKSNMSEWANFRSVRSTSGWSARGGLTRNPHALDRNASGSSSGSAVAVAANLCSGAIGTETDGSIVSPASVCGIVGLKPTVGLVSRSGLIPLARSQDTAGPMGRCVADVAALLDAMVGADPRDGATMRNGSHVTSDYTRALDPMGLKRARIGVLRDGLNPDARCDAILDEAIAAMKHAGAVVIDDVKLAGADALGSPEFEVVLRYQFKTGINAYLADLASGQPVRSLRALIDFNERNAAREMPYFGQDLLLRAERETLVSHSEYVQMRERNRRLAGAEGIDAALARHRLDAIVTITSGPAWLTDLVTGDHETQSMSRPAAVAGYPHITVPAGQVYGLPIGLSFFASAFSEPALLRVAYAFEQSTKMRRSPGYLATIEL